MQQSDNLNACASTLRRIRVERATGDLLGTSCQFVLDARNAEQVRVVGGMLVVCNLQIAFGFEQIEGCI